MEGWLTRRISGSGISCKVVVERHVLLKNHHDMLDRGCTLRLCGRDCRAQHGAEGCYRSHRFVGNTSVEHSFSSAARKGFVGLDLASLGSARMGLFLVCFAPVENSLQAE